MKQKFYCYVDETGQDTRGDLFIVSVVVADEERDALRKLCLDMERASRKGQRKWIKAGYSRRLAYVRGLLEKEQFRGKLYFASHRGSAEYTAMTVQTVARSLKAVSSEDYEATVFVDGLPRSLEQAVGLELRRSGIHAKKVRGVRDESETLVRLADAVCGMVRGATEGQPEMRALLERGIRQGTFVDMSKK